MADINLKDEKRLNVNGEYDLVTTHPNNEPIYRSNGHQLGFNTGNSDFISAQFSNTSITETSDIDLEFEFYMDSFDGGRIRLFHFRDENGAGFTDKAFWIETNTLRTDLILLQSNTDGSVISNAKNLGSPIIGVNRVKILNGEAFLNGVKTSSDPNNYTLDITNPYLKIAKFFNVSSFSDLTLFKSFKVQGESFNPTNINSNAQIEGSNGTIAQVNSSAADPINYILGTVFQKSGFALAFDSGNSEFITVNKTGIIAALSDIEFEATLDTTNVTSNVDVVYSIGQFSATDSGFFELRFSGSNNSILGISRENQNGSISGTFVATIPTGKIKLRFSNLELYVNDVFIRNFPEVSDMNIDLGIYGVFINSRNTSFGFTDFTFYNEFNLQGETIDLKRGLGVELIGSNGTTAEIKTSAANPQQRVNFGMWLKGDNINGWNPYTV